MRDNRREYCAKFGKHPRTTRASRRKNLAALLLLRSQKPHWASPRRGYYDATQTRFVPLEDSLGPRSVRPHALRRPSRAQFRTKCKARLQNPKNKSAGLRFLRRDRPRPAIYSLLIPSKEFSPNTFIKMLPVSFHCIPSHDIQKVITKSSTEFVTISIKFRRRPPLGENGRFGADEAPTLRTPNAVGWTLRMRF
jgi:hypothetical protein